MQVGVDEEEFRTGKECGWRTPCYAYSDASHLGTTSTTIRSSRLNKVWSSGGTEQRTGEI